MLRSSIITLFFFTIVATANSGIDLTPAASEFIGEGIKYQKITFQQDKQAVEYYPPPGWTFSGNAERVQLTPPKKNFAEAVIEAIPLSAPQALDEKVAKALEERFIASVPPGSQFVTLVNEEPNPVPIDGKPSYRVTASYQMMGEKFLKTAIFVNFHDVQVVFRLTARKDDFEALDREFRRSISSWHPIPPVQQASGPSGAPASADSAP